MLLPAAPRGGDFRFSRRPATPSEPAKEKKSMKRFRCLLFVFTTLVFCLGARIAASGGFM